MSSSYYWSMYRQKKQEAAKYGKQIKELTDIRKRLSNDFEDDVENVNGTLKKCSESVREGVKGVRAAEQWRYDLERAREKPVSSDTCLSAAGESLSEEIHRLERKKRDAEEAAERYRQLALEEEAAERAARSGGK